MDRYEIQKRMRKILEELGIGSVKGKSIPLEAKRKRDLFWEWQRLEAEDKRLNEIEAKLKS